jgi:very-short-patch-repair endonuclease
MKKKILVEVISTSKSKNEILLKYFGYSNKWAYNELNKFIIENNINISHLEKKIKYCLNCNKIIKTRNKFCNNSCAATFNNKKRILSDKTKNKISNSLNNRFLKEGIIHEIKNMCVICKNEFIVKRCLNGRLSKSKCCSNKCYLKLRHKNGKIVANERIANGTHNGWSTRNIISYPEQFFMTVLNNNNIKFKHNYPINKKNLGLNNSCNYFLDFFIEDKNIDLEIDGKQHKSRTEHDNFRDKILTENGYIVYRIKWKNINTENGKQYMKNEINKFLKFYNN